jgi:hypothetical protein
VSLSCFSPTLLVSSHELVLGPETEEMSKEMIEKGKIKKRKKRDRKN